MLIYSSCRLRYGRRGKRGALSPRRSWITQDPSGQKRETSACTERNSKRRDKLGIQWGRPDYQHAAPSIFKAWEKTRQANARGIW